MSVVKEGYKKIAVTRPCVYMVGELEGAKVVTPGTVLVLKAEDAAGLIHSQKAIEYTGKVEHLKVDDEIAKKYTKNLADVKMADPMGDVVAELQATVESLQKKVKELEEKKSGK